MHPSPPSFPASPPGQGFLCLNPWTKKVTVPQLRKEQVSKCGSGWGQRCSTLISPTGLANRLTANRPRAAGTAGNNSFQQQLAMSASTGQKGWRTALLVSWQREKTEKSCRGPFPPHLIFLDKRFFKIALFLNRPVGVDSHPPTTKYISFSRVFWILNCILMQIMLIKATSVSSNFTNEAKFVSKTFFAISPHTNSFGSNTYFAWYRCKKYLF